MGWDKGKYYTRSRRVHGRVVREYIGAGEAGEAAEALDELEREERQCHRERLKAEQAEIATFDDSICTICQLADTVAKAAMVAAGFRPHRGEWRRKRV